MTSWTSREPTSVHRFESGDGTKLYAEVFAPAKPVASLLLIHGYAEHAGRYRETASFFADHDIACVSIDLRGHGRSEGPRGFVTSFLDYVADIEAGKAFLNATFPALPCFVLCHSNGALATLRWFADPWRAPKDVRGLIVSSPFLKIKAHVPLAKRAVAQILGRALPSFSLPAGEISADHLTHDEQKKTERLADTLCHNVASARWYIDALKTQDWVKQFASRLAVPTLWLIGGADPLCDARHAEQVAKTVPSAEIHVLSGQFHEVFNEVERAETRKIALTFVLNKLSQS